MTLDLFDTIKAKLERDKGLDKVEGNNDSFVHRMRAHAKHIAQRTGHVTSDDLRRYASSHGLEPKHPNAWGAVFRGKQWICIGRRKSTLASNHAREIRIWGLRQ